MKKYILILVLFMSSFSYAQGVNFGVRGGLNLANADFEVSGPSASLRFDTDSRSSFYFGGFAEFDLKESPHKMQVGLILHDNGFKRPEEGNYIIFKISQLNLPLLYKFQAFEGLYLIGGSYAGAILNANNTFESEGVSKSESRTDEFKTFDFGLSIGAEYDFSNGFLIDVRYNYGILNVADTSEISADSEISFKNRFFTVGLGYKF